MYIFFLFVLYLDAIQPFRIIHKDVHISISTGCCYTSIVVFLDPSDVCFHSMLGIYKQSYVFTL